MIISGQMAAGAQLVLDEVTLQMLQHITTFTDEELKRSSWKQWLLQQAKRRLKRKKLKVFMQNKRQLKLPFILSTHWTFKVTRIINTT